MTEFDKEILEAATKVLIMLFSAIAWCCWMTFKKSSKKSIPKSSLTYL